MPNDDRYELRRLRQASGLSIRDLEARTGINRGRLSVLERGVEPSPAERQLIELALAENEGELREAFGK